MRAKHILLSLLVAVGIPVSVNPIRDSYSIYSLMSHTCKTSKKRQEPISSNSSVQVQTFKRPMVTSDHQ